MFAALEITELNPEFTHLKSLIKKLIKYVMELRGESKISKKSFQCNVWKKINATTNQALGRYEKNVRP